MKYVRRIRGSENVGSWKKYKEETKPNYNILEKDSWAVGVGREHAWEKNVCEAEVLHKETKEDLEKTRIV